MVRQVNIDLIGANTATRNNAFEDLKKEGGLAESSKNRQSIHSSSKTPHGLYLEDGPFQA